jgi:hypothetical protein
MVASLWGGRFVHAFSATDVRLHVAFDIGAPIKDSASQPDVRTTASFGALTVECTDGAPAVACILPRSEKVRFDHSRLLDRLGGG